MSYETIIVEKNDKIFKITLNRPQKKNCINDKMNLETVRALEEAAVDKDCMLTVITGAGDCYCSGADLSDAQFDMEYAKDRNKRTLKYVATFIDHPKPLIALVNGPAIGVGVTVLGLFDLIYASEKAFFLTPFTSLGMAPEGCSSYTFPKIMGPSKAAEMLLFGKKLDAQEAWRRGLVTEVFPSDKFLVETSKRLKQLTNLPPGSLISSKKLVRDGEREKLHKVNQAECDLLMIRWDTDEYKQAIVNFANIHKSKI